MYRNNYNLYPNVKVNHELYEPVSEEIMHFDHDNPNYKVKVTTWKCKDKTKHYWGNMSAQITDQNNKVCAEFDRNYYSLHGAFVTQNNTDYFITSSDYQCITIINLKTGEVKSYTDVDDIKHGCGFCPIYFDWDEGTLYVEGCVWAFPWETMKCSNIDLENPIPAFNAAEWIDEDGEVHTAESDNE